MDKYIKWIKYTGLIKFTLSYNYTLLGSAFPLFYYQASLRPFSLYFIIRPYQAALSLYFSTKPHKTVLFFYPIIGLYLAMLSFYFITRPHQVALSLFTTIRPHWAAYLTLPSFFLYYTSRPHWVVFFFYSITRPY